MTCSTCKHETRCDGIPGEDCHERVPDTEPCPPPARIEFDNDVTLADAYERIRSSMPVLQMTPLGKASLHRRMVLSGKFETLERVRAMRGTL